MNVEICERCGRTSQDQESAIEKVSIRARQNGTEESSFDGAIMACKTCRAVVHEALQKLVAPDGKLLVKVERVP